MQSILTAESLRHISALFQDLFGSFLSDAVKTADKIVRLKKIG